MYVFPIGSNYVLINEGRPWWDKPEDLPRSPFADAVPATLLMDLDDYLVFDATGGRIVGEGRFTHLWRLSQQQAAELRASGAVVVVDDAISADRGTGIQDLPENIAPRQPASHR